MWRGVKFAIPQAGATMKAQTNRYMKQANTITKKRKMLRGESVPPNEQYWFFDVHLVREALQSVTNQVVKLALVTQPVRKAPGQDKLSFGAMHLHSISKMYFSHWKPPGVSGRMWSVHVDVSSSGQSQTLGGHSDWLSE
jgi:hypothetical protein